LWGFNEKKKHEAEKKQQNRTKNFSKQKQQQPDFLSFFVKKEQTLSN